MRVSAKEPTRGYRGFVDMNAEALFKKKSYYGSHDIVFSVSGITTTHGFQFNNNFFVGGGSGIIVATSNYEYFSLAIGCPVYALGRFDWKISKVPLFADLKLGSYLQLGDRPFFNTLYINPSLGFRLPLSQKIAFNIGAGISGYCNNIHYDGGGAVMPSVKLGIEF